MFFFFVITKQCAWLKLLYNWTCGEFAKSYYFHEGAMYPARAHLETHQNYCRCSFQMSLLTWQPHTMPYCCYLTGTNPIISSAVKGAASKFCISHLLHRSLPWIQKAMVKFIYWCNYAGDLHGLKICSIIYYFFLRRLLIALMNISDAHLQSVWLF